MIRRFNVGLLFTFLLFTICLAEAQQPTKVPRIGFLDPTSRAVSEARIEAFQQGLRKFGYTEGKNIAIDYRFAEGRSERLRDLASELVGLNVDLIVTRATRAPLQPSKRQPPSLSFLSESLMLLLQGSSPASRTRAGTSQD